MFVVCYVAVNRLEVVMPKVGKMKFPYTAAGMADAKKAVKKQAAKKVGKKKR